MATLFGRLTSFSFRFSFSIQSENIGNGIEQLIKHLFCLLGEFYWRDIRGGYIVYYAPYWYRTCVAYVGYITFVAETSYSYITAR
jgi:hypothetical protein